MKGTDIFHLGDGYYVYVNYKIKDRGLVRVKTAEALVKSYVAWVGEWPNSLLVAFSVAFIYENDLEEEIDNTHLNLVKSEVAELIIKNKNELIELIREEEYWKHF